MYLYLFILLDSSILPYFSLENVVFYIKQIYFRSTPKYCTWNTEKNVCNILNIQQLSIQAKTRSYGPYFLNKFKLSICSRFKTSSNKHLGIVFFKNTFSFGSTSQPKAGYKSGIVIVLLFFVSFTFWITHLPSQ